MNRRPTDLRRYVLVRNLKRYAKALETIAPTNGNQESVATQDVTEEIIDPSNIKQEVIDPPNMNQEIIDPPTGQEQSIQAGSSNNSEQTARCSNPSNNISSSSSEEVSENLSTEDSLASKDTDLNTSAFALVASLFKPRKKRKKGIAKAKIVVKQVKCKKQSSLACAKEKDPISKKPKSLFSLFKTRKEKRNKMLGNKNYEPCSSSISSSPGTSTQSCQTDITWPDVGYDELQRSNQVLQESNRLLIENLSTLIQNINTKTTSSQPLGICTDAYGCENVDGSVKHQPSFSGSVETELRSPVRTRSHASKLHRSQTLVENSKSHKICTRSKSMLNPDRHCSPLRAYATTKSNFPHSSAPYQLRSTILKDVPVNTSHGIHRRSSMPERTSHGSMRPLLRRRSNNIFDYNHGSVTYPVQANADHSYHKPLSENFTLNKVKRSIVRRSSMPDRGSRDQMSYRRSTVQRCNTFSFQDKHNYKRGEYNRSTRFQDLPSEAFY